MLTAPTVYLIRSSKRLKHGKRATYYVLKWAGTDGRWQEESAGRTKQSGGTVTKARAEEIRREKEQAIGTGKIPRDKSLKLTLAEFIEHDLATIKPDVKPNTYIEYELAGNHAIAAIGGATPLAGIGWAEVGKVKSRLAAEHDIKGQKRAACRPATIRKTIVTLKAMFNRALEQRFVISNPFAGQRLLRVQSKRKRIYTRKEVACMIEAAPDAWWEAFLKLAVTTGFRRSELLHLQWQDIDFAEQTVTVAAKRLGSFTVGGVDYPILEWSAKSYHERVVPIPPDTVRLLQRLKVKSAGSLYVFLSLQRLSAIRRHIRDGQLPAKFDLVNNLGRQFAEIQEAARGRLAKARRVEVDKVEWPMGCIHDLRRTYATWMARVVPMHVLRTYMGHQDIGTTADYYLGVDDEAADRARKALSLSA